jgi:hypothetical protein
MHQKLWPQAAKVRLVGKGMRQGLAIGQTTIMLANALVRAFIYIEFNYLIIYRIALSA